MRRYRASTTAFLVLIVTCLWGGKLSFSKDRFHQFTMENGVKAILKENRAAPVVALQVWVKVGSADESDGEAGICHFIEHMLFKGTEKRKIREMAKEIESLGGSINAYTSYDQTVYHVTLASRYADTGLDLLKDAIRYSIFDPLELEREREVVLEEIRMGQDSPWRRLFNQTMATLYQHHPYGRPVIGYEKTIRLMTREQIVSFFKKWYTPSDMVFIAVGDFDLQEMETKVREVFRGFEPSSERLRERVAEPRQEGFRSAISSGNFKETYLQIAIPISSAREEDTAALDALSQILGGGEASRLVQKVKLEKGLVNSVSSSSFTPKDPGVFIIRSTLAAENLEKAVGSILGEVVRLGKEGVTPEELHRVKVNVESSLVYDRQTVQGEARKLGYYELVAEDVRFENEYMKRVALLETEDIQRVVEKYFRPSQMVVSMLVPSEKTDLVKNMSLKPIIEKMGIEAPLFKDKKMASFSRTVLDNGVRLVVKENRSIPIVSVQASFLGGVRWEGEAQSGINNFMAVMVTKGTEDRNSFEVAKKVETMAGSINGFSGFNSFGLTFTFLSQHFEEAFALFAEMIKKPAFDTEEMEKRRRLIMAAIRQQEDDLSRLVFKLFRKTLFEKHPYRMDSLGTLESVRSMSQKGLKEYYERIVVPENMVLTVVGDVDEEQVILAARKAFGSLKRTALLSPIIPQEPPLQEIRRHETNKTKEQAHFILGFLGVPFRHKDRYALEVLDAALSGQTGRLFRELRDKESLAYALNFMVSQLGSGIYRGLYGNPS